MKWEYFYHYYSFYFSIGLSLIITFSLLTKETIEKTSRVILPAFIIIVIPPIIDVLLSWGKGYPMTYIIPEHTDSLLLKYLTFFGHFKGQGITPGMRIEIALITLFSFIYFKIKTKKPIKSIFFSLLTYTLIFTYCAMPFIITALIKVLKLSSQWNQFPLTNFFIILIFIQLIIVFYLYNKTYFLETFKDIRPFRLIHYQLMFLLGITLTKIFTISKVTMNEEILINLILNALAITFAWLFSIFTNNIADYDIDSISNKSRPLIKRSIPITDYKILAFIFLFSAMVCSLTTGATSFFLISLFISNYLLYSFPPLRLKQVPFFSKLFISLNSIILTTLGYYVVIRHFKAFTTVTNPAITIFAILLFFTAGVNFIDIKDYHGDKKCGIKTLPVIFGLEKSKLIIGAFFLFSYPLFYFILKDIRALLILVFIGIIQFVLINRKNYSEKPVFLVHLASIIMHILYLNNLSQ